MAEYEFTEEQNQSIRSLNLHIRMTTIMLTIFSITWLIPISSTVSNEGIAALLTNGQAYSMVLFIIMAYMVWRVSPHLQRITTTQGKDISELLGGLHALGVLNGIGRILLGAGLILLVLRIFA